MCCLLSPNCVPRVTLAWTIQFLLAPVSKKKKTYSKIFATTAHVAVSLPLPKPGFLWTSGFPPKLSRSFMSPNPSGEASLPLAAHTCTHKVPLAKILHSSVLLAKRITESFTDLRSPGPRQFSSTFRVHFGPFRKSQGMRFRNPHG